METREKIETEIADLRRQRGYAHLHGKKFDDAAITQAQQKLDALDDAQVEQTRQSRETAQADYRADLASKRAKLSAMVADDLADSQTAQEAARVLAAAFNRRLNRVEQMAQLCHAISGERGVPICLQKPELERTLASRLSAVVGGGLPINCRRMFGGKGGVTFHPGVCKQDDNWKDQDAATFDKHLKPLIEGN